LPQLIVAVWTHVPAPEQFDGGWWVVTLHDSARPQAFDAGCCWQAPDTQTPVLPHSPLLGQRPCGSAELLVTFAQVPLPLALQDWHVAQLEVVQQTPSVQLPAAHSLAAPQAAPFAFLATQLPAVVVLPVQKALLAHCVSAVQLVRQALTPHA
jgi:hypothetical protein